MLKRFFYASAAVLMLALAYHLGAGSATAQPPSNPVVGVAAVPGGMFAGTANGDFYVFGNGGPAAWRFAGNIFSGSPTPTQQESWGQLKARYRNTPGTAQPGTQNR